MSQRLSFAPVSVERDVEGLSRPSLSYWQDAWIRLRANKRAFASLFIVVGLILFASVGPVVWQVKPGQPNLDAASKPPWADRRAQIVERYKPWEGLTAVEGSERAGAPQNFRVIDNARSDGVRLAWTPVERAAGYKVYRNILDPRPDHPLGVPVGNTRGQYQVSLEDRLDLQDKTYWYSVVAVDENGALLPGASTIEVEVRRVISLAEAQEKGWIGPDEHYDEGAVIYMPLHPLGTDYLGRDMLARLIEGARVSLFIGVIAPLLFVIGGVFYGAIAGFMGGIVDQVLMRFADFVVALPFLLFMILFKLVFGIGPGESGLIPMLVALILLSWPATARLVRGQILQIREEGFVSASRLLGTGTGRLILRHMVPNTMGVILVTFTFAVPSAIFTEAFLSFIGMGVEPPTASWGSMCNEGRKTMIYAPHELIFPAILISIAVLAFNLLGDGLRDALDARMRSTE